MPAEPTPLLAVTDLHTHFFTERGEVRAVDGISFEVARGEVLCLVGESGSGKSVASLSILGLVPDPPGRVVGGTIAFSPDGGGSKQLLSLDDEQLRAIRGDRIAMIFQDPMTSLNPYLKVGVQLREVLEVHQRARGDAKKRCIDMLAAVGIPAPAARFDDYPHQLSGGMRQRVMIAMALLCDPDLLIADEPTTALDVTIQAQILDLIEERKNTMNVGVVLITHDLGVVARMADRVAVMYAGKLVEQGGVDAIFAAPQHPYTRALQRAIARIDPPDGREALQAIEGLPPSPGALPNGCAFHPRCTEAIDICAQQAPPERLFQVRQGGASSAHRARCHLLSQVGEGT